MNANPILLQKNMHELLSDLQKREIYLLMKHLNCFITLQLTA